jgi:hypothetical protein
VEAGMTEKTIPIVYVVSDSVGETGELVVRAAASQFGNGEVAVRRISYVDDEGTILEVVQACQEVGAILAYTLVVDSLRTFLQREAAARGVIAVDIMGPLLEAFGRLLNIPSKMKPGLVHQLDDEYFRKVEAIEFAVKYDDGRDPRGILRADVVLIGVSRTSKTPLSMYLAHKRLKVANIPLVPEVEPPEELFMISPSRCIGLMINAAQLNNIRRERLKALGLTAQANYANVERINEELRYADQVMQKIGCQVIDVSNKAVEEIANLVLDIYRRNVS